MTREKEIEKYLENRISALGGYCRKWVSPGHNGVPDRIIILNGTVCFIETKAPEKKARKLQEKEIGLILEQGIFAGVIDSRQKVDELISSLLRGDRPAGEQIGGDAG